MKPDVIIPSPAKHLSQVRAGAVSDARWRAFDMVAGRLVEDTPFGARQRANSLRVHEQTKGQT